MANQGDLNKEKNVGDGHDNGSGSNRSVHSPKDDKMDEAIGRRISEEVAKAFEQTMPIFLAKIQGVVKAAFVERENKTKEDEIIIVDGSNKDKGKEKERRPCTYKDYMICKPKDFHGEVDPLVSQRWITEIESTFETCHYDPEDRVVLAVNQLKGRAKDSLHNLRKEKDSIGSISWEEFKEAFLKNHCPQAAVDHITEEFLRMRQYNESIDELAGMFYDKSQFCPELEVEVASKKTKLASPSKKPFVKATARYCRTCGNEHSGECRIKTKSCYICGKPGHIDTQCSSPINLCYNCYKPGLMRNECPELKQGESGGKKLEIPRPKGRAFQITAEEAKKTPDVVSGVLMINSLSTLTLFDSGASRSFISLKFANRTSFLSKRLGEPLEIEVVNDRSFLVFDVYVICKLEAEGETFSIDLIRMTLGEFDVIVGMDWLYRYRVNIMCGPKPIQLISLSRRSLYIRGERIGGVLLCSYLKAMKYIVHGCKAFMACVMDSSRDVRSYRGFQPREKWSLGLI
ncbi:hypothetical protein L1987_07057 [Smallanthus sonchifolius]|uniref:Uncharacterized protein n=1 Tax=Smallanthus sonchifolius TaxID=185202 RepID=A0ACB9K004_9ASTR|nr:hypothetical protein L1987_07057 [Smallanthus sonchifolius]